MTLLTLLVVLIIAVLFLVIVHAVLRVAPINADAKAIIEVVFVCIVVLWVLLSLFGHAPVPRLVL